MSILSISIVVIVVMAWVGMVVHVVVDDRRKRKRLIDRLLRECWGYQPMNDGTKAPSERP